MLDVALTMLALFAGGLVIEIFAVSRAPVGYQDENGFHFGIPVEQGPDASVLSAPQPRRANVRTVALGDTQLAPAGHA